VICQEPLLLPEFKDQAQQLDLMSNLGHTDKFSNEQINRYINLRLRRWKLHTSGKKKIIFVMIIWK